MATYIVSNRLPYAVGKAADGGVRLERSPGGLVAAMMPVHQGGDSWWVGHAGLAAIDADLEARFAAECLVDVPIPEEEYRGYYMGASNGSIWPLFHYFPAIARFDAAWWASYRAVNRRYAEVLLARLRPDDLVWVHDYQLMLLPGMLRARLPGLRIGYFHHIPFPSSEVFKLLPWRDEVAEGLLGADVVGFHTLEYARHFAGVVGRQLGLEVDAEDIHVGDRVVRTGAFPLGIDVASMAAAAADPRCQASLIELEGSFAGKRLVLGVDRLDYTKGIAQRLEAFAEFLRRHPDEREHTVLLQLCVPSRVEVASYATLREEVERLVGRINGEHGTASNQPVRYLFQNRDLPELVALYRRADVCLVTPLRDGLNLVCKEYCAVREDLGGALILSEFAGAAEEMGEALIVNPFDVQGVAEAIHAALVLPDGERRERMRALRTRVLEVDNRAWAAQFIAAVDEVAERNRTTASRSLDTPAVVRAAAAPLRRAGRVLAVLDEGAFRSQRGEAVGLLQRCIDQLRGALRDRLSLLVITGRRRAEAEALVGGRGVWLGAEHGALLRHADGRWEVLAGTEALERSRGQILRVLEALVRKVPRSRLEQGEATIGWSMGRMGQDMARVMQRETVHALDEMLRRSELFCTATRRGLVVRPAGHGPAAAVERVLALLPVEPPPVLVTVGDRHSDDGLFRLHAERNVSVAIGTPVSSARYLAADADELLAALAAAESA